ANGRRESGTRAGALDRGTTGSATWSWQRSDMVLEGLVIDTDHWRHLYLIIGMIWGFPRPPIRGRSRNSGKLSHMLCDPQRRSQTGPNAQGEATGVRVGSLCNWTT
ncbi:MAG: hypothetical protein ACRD3W_25105, partial [Terriglobales bacterium]